jgi:hypothetical protein
MTALTTMFVLLFALCLVIGVLFALALALTLYTSIFIKWRLP